MFRRSLVVLLLAAFSVLFAAGCLVTPDAAECAPATTCDSCIRRSGCGWCARSSRCIPGSSLGPTASCGTSLEWSWSTCTSTDRCDRFASCSSCLQNGGFGCSWCPALGRCVGSANLDVCAGFYTNDSARCAVDESCNFIGRCGDCTSFTGCQWCDLAGGVCTALACPRNNVYQLSPTCPPPNTCSDHEHCSDCLAESGCSWCESASVCISTSGAAARGLSCPGGFAHETNQCP